MEIIFLAIVSVIILGIIVFWLSRQKKFTTAEYNYFATQIKKTANIDSEHAILTIHKIFVKALKSLSKNQSKTAAKTISLFQKRFPNKNQIWRFHKRRNQLAHEINIKTTNKEADQMRKEYLKALNSLTKT